jgi:CheY-like chemotaxis protein
LIVLDLLLPKVDGWTGLKHPQEDKDLREIPVIVTTAMSPDRPQIKGADAILETPFDPARLVTEIARLLADALECKPRRRSVRGQW